MEEPADTVLAYPTESDYQALYDLKPSNQTAVVIERLKRLNARDAIPLSDPLAEKRRRSRVKIRMHRARLRVLGCVDRPSSLGFNESLTDAAATAILNEEWERVSVDYVCSKASVLSPKPRTAGSEARRAMCHAAYARGCRLRQIRDFLSLGTVVTLSQISEEIRRHESHLKRLEARGAVLQGGRVVSPELGEQPYAPSLKAMVSQVLLEMSTEFNVPVYLLCRPTRQEPLNKYRGMVMRALSRRVPGISHAQIGKLMGVSQAAVGYHLRKDD